MRDWLSSTAASPSPTWSRILTADFMDDFLEQTFHLFLYVTVKRLPCQEISKFFVTATCPRLYRVHTSYALPPFLASVQAIASHRTFCAPSPLTPATDAVDDDA